MPDLPYPSDGGMVHGHLAVPGGPGSVPPPERWPGVVVIHEAFGLTEDIRQQAERLSRAGFLAFAPDLYLGKSWVRCVRGFCMGGGFALLCAPRDGFAAVSINYGDVPADAEAALEGACPIVGSFGGRAPMGPKPPARPASALTDLGVPHDIKVSPEAGHRFMNQTPAALGPLAGAAHMNYHENAAEDS